MEVARPAEADRIVEFEWGIIVQDDALRKKADAPAEELPLA